MRILAAALSEHEILILLADHITVPKHIRFEVNIKREMNSKLKRLGLAGVCRIDSRANDLLQLVDLIVGAISYDLKIQVNAIAGGDKNKKALLDFFKQSLGVDNFISGFRNRVFNIFVDKDVKQRLPLDNDANEKGPSS